eukprot:CAMPEP_0177623282 /NCGR_PEP_ID=MMETSP0419_2-20121207/28820_1 /TAXON_ID=582737 /ORGANISM="Tetraselmis sp., Strain GSL018" /LENGTH=99 /DNA_ID=CAMNT_0019123825 /DNA_START=164 /DNA_END=464 /DNA_ORIENTATION=+
MSAGGLSGAEEAALLPPEKKKACPLNQVHQPIRKFVTQASCASPRRLLKAHMQSPRVHLLLPLPTASSRAPKERHRFSVAFALAETIVWALPGKAGSDI